MQCGCCLRSVERRAFISLAESNGLYSGKQIYSVFVTYSYMANRQDLNSSILAGSRRVFDHTTFTELQWTRDSFSPNFFSLPPGLQVRSDILTKEFVEVLEDIHALQCIRDIPGSTRDVMLMTHINNHTASIQSRLVNLPKLSPLLRCCHLAAYVCSIRLCCTVWCPLVIPVS
jgi:hypothetical protein